MGGPCAIASETPPRSSALVIVRVLRVVIILLPNSRAASAGENALINPAVPDKGLFEVTPAFGVTLLTTGRGHRAARSLAGWPLWRPILRLTRAAGSGVRPMFTQSRRFVDAIGCSMAVWLRFFASKTVTCGFGCLFFISFAAFSAASYVPNPDFSCRSTAT